MSFPGVFLVVYTGIVGGGGEEIDRQIGVLLSKEAGVTRVKASMSLDSRKILARHESEAGDLVRGLATDGVVAGEITRTHSGKTLHLVVYNGEGRRKDVLELPLDGGKLGADNLETLQSNIVPDVKALAKTKPKPKPAPEPEPEVVVEVTPPETPETPETPTAEENATGTPPPSTPIMEEGPRLGLDGAVGFGMTARAFSPGPPSIIGYTSTPVATIRFDGALRPRPTIFLDFALERTVGMSSTVENAAASTFMQRWEISGGIELVHSAIKLAPLVGVGQRAFSIDSKSVARTPDTHYTYLDLGVAARVGGSALSLSAAAIIQPVTGGDSATDMEFGEARRFALDGELMIDWHPWPSIFLRPRVSYQRFIWAFPNAGDRGSGGVADSYFSGELSVGATY